MFHLPYELQLYIYDFDDNQYYKSVFKQCITMIKYYNAKHRALNYFSELYKDHYLYCEYCKYHNTKKLTSGQYILRYSRHHFWQYHSNKSRHLINLKYIKPSHVRKPV